MANMDVCLLKKFPAVACEGYNGRNDTVQQRVLDGDVKKASTKKEQYMVVEVVLFRQHMDGGRKDSLSEAQAPTRPISNAPLGGQV
jgi:hypothetical protein